MKALFRNRKKAVRRVLCRAGVTFAVFLVASGAARADVGPSPSPSASPKALDTVIVTAQRHASPIGATSRDVYVLQTADIERSGARTIADALRYVPGVSVAAYGNAGQLQTVSLRGAGSLQTLVLLDGRPVNEPDTGLADFSSISIEDVSRIEVVEGGASTLYGSSAVGGVIDIITRSPGASGGSASAYAEGGYEGTFEDGVSITRGDARTLWVHASGRSLHARNSYDYPAFADAAAGTRTNDDVNLAEASLDVGKALGTTRAELRLNQDESNVGSPGDVTCCISGLARQQRDVRRADITIDALTRLGMLSLQGYVDSRRLHFFDPTPPLRYDTFTSALSRGFSLRDTSAVGRDHTFTLGYDVRDDGALFAASYYTAPASVDDASSAFYLEDEVRRPGSPLSVSAGLRRELPQGTQAPVTPSLGIVERLAHGFALRANYGRAFRVPSLDERYFPSYGNPKLQPEYSATFDAGAALDLKGGDASLTYFGSDSENLIVNVPVDAVGDEKPFNIDRARIRGIDGQVTSRVGTLTSARLSLTSLFAARDLESGRPLPYRPGMSVAVTAWHTSRSTEYGLSGRYVGRRDAPGTSRSIALPAYALGDAWVTRRFGSGTKLTLRLENIGGSHAEEDVLGYPVLGPTASLRVSIAR